ncbi:piggyBac transposable element-derived protein 3-like [Pseudochaenichthys georgianus]|uniref:piggyBac transposable element-derived protein 3-like n=1 Tax=Pseudochaenichthys georgianus TaxID=52239 RepID=UPI0039C4E08C
MAANTRDNSSGSSKYKPRQERFSVQRALELLGLIDGDNSDLEDLSDNDDPILDANYQPPPQEQISSEDEDDSSDDEDPIPQPTEHSRGRSGTGTDTGSSRTPRRRRQTQQIEADRSDDDSEEPTPGPSTQGQPNKDEVYHFFGACILMSCIRYPTIRMYWSKALRITAITDRFTCDRFFRLRGSIKVLIDDDVPEDLRKRDKFWKVRPFLDRILQGCKSQNRPDCASTDEQMIPFTGACPYRQYLPMKPNPVGIKNFVCATAYGIVLDFDLYQGKGALLEQVEEEEVGLGLGGLVLASLCQTLHRGTKVYCDRFFTSIRCVEQMMKKEMYITGTIMKNRLAGAKEKLPSDKTMKNTGRGTSSELSTEDGKMCLVKWYDNKPVLMMSVVHGTEPEDTCQCWDKKLKQYVTVSRPSIVREYNLKMGGVDLIDRMISYYRMSARTKKWTMQMLMHFTDLALANSWLLYRKDLAICAAPKKSIMQFLEFRTEMATTLLAQHHGQGSDADLSEQSEEEDNSNQRKKRPVMAVPHVSVRRRANAHLPEMISLKNAARCRVAGCTGRTRVRCVTCKVFLCLQGDRNCYTAFHT